MAARRVAVLRTGVTAEDPGSTVLTCVLVLIAKTHVLIILKMSMEVKMKNIKHFNQTIKLYLVTIPW